MSRESLTEKLKAEARRLGFDLTGACPAVAPPGIDRFRQWLEAGCAGRMEYLPGRAEAYEHPRHVLDGVRSLLVLALNYRTEEPVEAAAGQGNVSRYAWGQVDYHDHIRQRLRRLARFHRHLTPQARVRGVVDTAPLLEREFARLAGLGWIGKNTLLLNRRLGSWFFLAALLTSEPLDYDDPFTADHCGSCRACLDACPTGALVDAYQLDARKCISYLTIELREPVPADLRPATGPWVFGCDVCQDVCPWNRRTPQSGHAALRPVRERNPMELAELFALDDEAFRARFRGTPLWRPGRGGMLRNAALALGNNPCEEALPALVRGLHDVDPLVRSASAWALSRYGEDSAREALGERMFLEKDAAVHAEIAAARAATESPATGPSRPGRGAAAG